MSKWVSFYTDLDTRVSGCLRLPAKSHDRKAPGVILCNGMFGLAEQKPLPYIAEKLAAEGYVTLQLDYRGFGRSGGERWRIDLSMQVEDLRGAVTYLEKRPEVASDRLAIWGTSLGGLNVIWAAVHDRRVKCCVAAVPSVGGRGGLGRSSEESADFLERVEKDRLRVMRTGKSQLVDPFVVMYPHPTHDDLEFWATTMKEVPERAKMRKNGVPFRNFWSLADKEAPMAIDVIKRVSPTPILYVFGTKDWMYADQRKLFDAAPEPKKLVLLQDAMHHEAYDSPHISTVLEETKEWFEHFL